MALAAVFALAPGVLLAAEEEGGEHSGGGLHYATTFWAIVSFLIVLAIIWRKVLPPILSGLDRRSQEIREQLQAAETARSEAEEMMMRHQENLDKARQESRAIIEEGKADAQRVRERIVAEARQEAEEISARARREIDLSKQAAIEDLHQQSVQLAIDLAGRLIEKNLSPEDHQQLIQERVRRFEARS